MASRWDSVSVLGCSSGDSSCLTAALTDARAVVLTFISSECTVRDMAVVKAVDMLVAAVSDRLDARALQHVIFGLDSTSAAGKAVIGRLAEECPRSLIALCPPHVAAEWCGLGRVAALPESVLCDVEQHGTDGLRLHPRYTEMGADLKANPQTAAYASDRFPHSWPRNCVLVRVGRQELGLSRRVILPSGAASGGAGLSGDAALPALPFFAAHTAPDALLQLPFYSGDPVLVKRIGDCAMTPSSSASAAPADSAALAGATTAAGPASDARPRATLRSLVVYMCPPPEADDDDDDDKCADGGAAAGGSAAASACTAVADAAAAGSSHAVAPSLFLAPSVCSDLGIRDGDSVCLLPYEDLPPAREIRVALKDTSQVPAAATVRSLTDAAKATLGLPGAGTRGATTAPEARVTAAISQLYEAALDAASAPAGVDESSAVCHVSDTQRQYLEELVKRGECRCSPLVEGQTLPVAASGGAVSLKVVHTEPRHTAVMIEPGTILRWA